MQLHIINQIEKNGTLGNKKNKTYEHKHLVYALKRLDTKRKF